MNNVLDVGNGSVFGKACFDGGVVNVCGDALEASRCLLGICHDEGDAYFIVRMEHGGGGSSASSRGIAGPLPGSPKGTGDVMAAVFGGNSVGCLDVELHMLVYL